MIFEPLAIEGVWRVRLSPLEDDRGFFARSFCSDEFASHGLAAVYPQSSLSRNRRKGTLRGMHYQEMPYAETKFVRCVRGAVVDVALDLRCDSPTYKQWHAERLDADDGVGLYIGPGIAHGFQTIADDSDVLYQITPAFRPGLGRGVRWDDPAFAIHWPITDPLLSSRDASYDDWSQ